MFPLTECITHNYIQKGHQYEISNLEQLLTPFVRGRKENPLSPAENNRKRMQHHAKLREAIHGIAQWTQLLMAPKKGRNNKEPADFDFQNETVPNFLRG